MKKRLLKNCVQLAEDNKKMTNLAASNFSTQQIPIKTSKSHCGNPPSSKYIKMNSIFRQQMI